MEVIIQSDAASATALAAEIIADALRSNSRLVLGLATGRTMDTVYGRLTERHRIQALDFSGCRTFNLDEYVGLPADDPYSFRHYMNRQLFSKVNIHPHNTRDVVGRRKRLPLSFAGTVIADLIAFVNNTVLGGLAVCNVYDHALMTNRLDVLIHTQ